MINLETNEMDGEPIGSWVVWFRTLHGLHKTLEEAQLAAVAAEMPFYMIRPVPVALSPDGKWYEERP
jgi:hypothetical protein